VCAIKRTAVSRSS